MTVKLAKKRTMTKRNVDQDGMIMIMTPTRTIIVKIIVINVGTDAGRNRDNIFARQLANGCKCVCSTAKRSTKSASLSRACTARSTA